jgi:hypothetical protein
MDSGLAALSGALGGALIGAIATLGGTLLNAHLARTRPNPADETAKALLTYMLKVKELRWRTIHTMANVIGRTDERTRELLLAIGARGSEANPDLWGLISRNPLPPQSGVKDPTLPY